MPHPSAVLPATPVLAALEHHLAGRLDEARRLYVQVLDGEPAHAEALSLLGVLAQQQGDGEGAVALLRRAVEAAPEPVVYRFALADVLKAAGRLDEARATYQQGLGQAPGHADAWFNLGRVFQALHRCREATTSYARGLALQPTPPADTWCDVGVAHMALEDWSGAADCFAQALAVQPGHAVVLNNLGATLKSQGRREEARACFDRALVADPALGRVPFNIGTLYFDQQDWEQATAWYQRALAVEPDQVGAHQNLAAIYLDAGRLEAAQFHRDRVYRRQAVFVEHAPEAAMVVLVLWAAGKGNVPIDQLLPRRSITRIVVFIEYLDAAQESRLPAYDFVFNAVGDADVTGPTAAPMAAFLARCTRPVLNLPEAVARTARDQAGALLGSIPGLVVPATVRFDTAALRTELPRTQGLEFPVIVRPGNSHGGSHLARLDSAQDLRDFEPFNAAFYYATAYVDYRSGDGFFRKYRMVFIDRQPFAYHLAIGERWMVHHATAGMEDHAWKRAEEAAFLADSERALGAAALATLRAIGRRLDLDYAGVDFGLLPDGRVLLFEANATMLAHPEVPGSLFGYKNPYVRRIYEAFNTLMARAAAG
ncbi:MAG: tetratricopeptide repeat protein [Pseudomonadota bacterium]